jgi:hypothetical protein
MPIVTWAAPRRRKSGDRWAWRDFVAAEGEVLDVVSGFAGQTKEG